MAAATGLVLGAAQVLFAALQSKEVRELCSIFGYLSKLDFLQQTVETIQVILLDLESKEKQLNNQGLDWASKLKDAIYDADDLFDELATLVKLQERILGGKISKTVHAFFSNENQLLFAVRTFRKIKKIRENLDRIAKDRTQFGLSEVYTPVKRTIVETGSYVHEDSIKGREADKDCILDMLSLGDSDPSINDVSFVSIVGMGGIGKTALAQLMYDDDMVNREFKLKLWVCVSDEFSMEEILRKMLKSTTEQNPSDLGTDGLQKKVRKCIEGEKYFLVLDDMWNERRDDWIELREFLRLGARGSRVVVTTRSEKVAKAIGNYPMYKLGGLSFGYSLSLFKSIAFNQGSKQVVDDVFVEDIVKKCANVPLAIRVVGSMLYDQDKSEWELFRRHDLAEIDQGKEGIMSILKFSYCQLTPQLKSCFSYCALFPKDYVIEKELLICLWSAQGYLMDDRKSIEDVGKDYFSILLHRCFFQGIKYSLGEIYSCKMHDLIHDLAKQVAGKDLYLMKENSTSHLDRKTHHLSISVWHSLLLSPSDTFGKLRGLRTFLRPSNRQLDCESQMIKILANCERLRALDLHKFSIKVVPSTITNLIHLRYLDLSKNRDLVMLPKSIAKLHNLEVLNLGNCLGLKELPEDLRELVKLRHLDISHCLSLTHMPAGMDSMTGLHTLTRFVLGPRSSKEIQIGQLRDLMPLNNLRGTLDIVFMLGYSNNASNAEVGAYLLEKEHIKTLIIQDIWHNKETVILDETLLKKLQPHHDLESIEISGYKGIALPRWTATLAISLPCLVSITLSNFHDLQHLPALGQLRLLKKLCLNDMPNVAFMKDDNGAITAPSFKSLKSLFLKNFPRMISFLQFPQIESSFPSLESLVLEKCPSMKFFPGCPNVTVFSLCGLNEELTFGRHRENEAIATAPAASSYSASSSSTQMPSDIASTSDNINNNSTHTTDDDAFNLWILEIDNLELLNSLFGQSRQRIRDFRLQNLKVESLSSVKEGYTRYTSSLHCLQIKSCPYLKTLLGGVEHCTNLKQLTISDCRNLELEDDGIPWKSLCALHYLNLSKIPQLIGLPKGIKHLSSLQFLTIHLCWNLECLPEWLECLKLLQSLTVSGCRKLKSLPDSILPSLKSLFILTCDELKERYSEPNGIDWSKISHIQNLTLSF